ncbi:MAG TPA: M48 family metallopeptidase [Planctomycetota bacterium]|nr:M48 family metallopeptidase [Planctomycetota bacterium]
MKRALSVFASIGLMTALVVGTISCEKVEGTGRGTFYLLSAEEENKMGADAYKEIVSKEKVSTDAEIIALVERVGKRLAAAAPDKGFKYDFTVLESDQVNAFCLPGGKVCVYTGILPYCQNEAGLATVMGHEIAHAIARHGGERMSKGLIVEGVGAGIDALLSERGASATTKNVTRAAYGAGTTVGVMLPYSRSHESEADYLGLTYMSKAGYDPNEAPKFWERFSALKSNVPNFLSTHPASEDRARDLKAKLPEGQKLYEAAANKYGAGEAIPERYRKAAAPAAKEEPAKKEPPAEQPKKKKKKK